MTDQSGIGSSEIRPRPSAARVVGALALCLLAIFAIWLAILVVYGFTKEYGASLLGGLGGLLIFGLVLGSIAGAALFGAARMVGMRRVALPVGLVTLAAVMVGTCVASAMGDRVKQQELHAMATACNAPVYQYVVELAEATGRIIGQNDMSALAKGDGTCDALVGVPRGGVEEGVAAAAAATGWTPVEGHADPTWQRGSVIVTYGTDEYPKTPTEAYVTLSARRVD